MKMKKISIVLLFALPALFCFIGILYKSEIGFYHLFITDPEYAYLLNGLNICQFSFPYQVNGPGTPLQFFCAIIIGIVHFFRDQDSMIVDVIQNPDIYLDIIHTSLVVVSSIAIFLTGYIISTVTGNIFTGIYFQLMPFVSWLLIDITKHIMVENFVVIGIMMLIAIAFIYINDQHISNNTRIINRYIIGFSIIIAFIAANKLMYLPIALIPFLLIDGYIRKITYILLSMVAFALFAFPIFPNWVSFRDWYWTNLIYSGMYGTGTATFIDIESFITNLKSVFYSDHFYLKAFSIILFGSMVYHLPFLKIKKSNDRSYIFLLGIATTMIIMTLLVAKQFKFYYLTSALLLSIPGLYLVFSIFTRRLSEKVKLIIAVPFYLITLYLAYRETKVMFDYHQANIQRKELLLNTKVFIEKRYASDQPTLLIPNYYGAPYKAHGLFYGMAWCGPKMGAKYAVALNKYYPHIYFYHTWNNLFNQWGNSFSYIDLLQKYKNIVLFSGDKNLENSLFSKLHGMNRQLDTNIDTTITFEKTGERIYEVSYDSVIGAMPFEFYIDAEVVDSTGEYFICREGLKIGNGNTQSSDVARSGRYSSKLTKDSPYGMTCILSEVKADEHFKISTWRYNNGNHDAGLVTAANDINKLYILKKESSINENGWQKIEIDLIIPVNAHVQDLKIYCWNKDPGLPAYFDDLFIEKIVP
ncbi:MAG: hypothetical protein JW973_00705 [Bacteroidales bacterium]|nr:hypothetical protein [Bacteroidales bacterium]